MAISGRRELFFGTSIGKTFNFSESDFSDDGTPINSRVRTKEYYLSGPDQVDEIKYIYAYSDEPQGGNISISIDGSEYEQLGSLQNADNPERFDVWKDCHHFSLGIDEVYSNNFRIKGFNTHYEVKPQIL